MTRLKGGETCKGFFDILASVSEKKAAKGNAGLFEAVMEYVNSKNPTVRKAAEKCALALVIKNNEAFANAVVEMCSDPGSNQQRVLRMQALGCCGEHVPDIDPKLEAEEDQYRSLLAAEPAKRARIVEIKKKQAANRRMREEQGIVDTDDDNGRGKVKRSSGLRDKLKGRQKSEGAQLEAELDELEKEMLSLDSGSFKAALQKQGEAWQDLRQVPQLLYFMPFVHASCTKLSCQ